MAQVPPPPPPPPPAWGAPAPPPGWVGSGFSMQGPMLPGSGRFRAQGVGQLLDSAFALYRRNVLLVIAITAVARVPLAVVQYVAFLTTGVSNASQQLNQFGQQARGLTPDQQVQQLQNLLGSFEGFFLVAGAIALIDLFLIQPIATAAMTRAVSDLYLERPTSVGAAYGAFLQRARPILGASALVSLAVIGIYVAAVVLLLLAVLAFGAGGLVLLILIVPGAIALFLHIYARWAFVTPVVVIEGSRARAALSRSWQLVRGSTWRVLGIRLLVLLITGVLSSIISGLLTLFTQVGDVSLQLALSQLAQLLAAVVIQPIVLITVVLLYYDQRIRREAFDIEMLAATL